MQVGRQQGLEMLSHPLGDMDGSEIHTPRNSPVPNMRQGSGQGDGGEILTIQKSHVTDMRQAVGQGNLRLIRQESNHSLALYIYQTAVLE